MSSPGKIKYLHEQDTKRQIGSSFIMKKCIDPGAIFPLGLGQLVKLTNELLGFKYKPYSFIHSSKGIQYFRLGTAVPPTCQHGYMSWCQSYLAHNLAEQRKINSIVLPSISEATGCQRFISTSHGICRAHGRNSQR